MKEIIEKVLKEEEQARNSIEKAKAQADSIIAKSRKDAALIIEETVAQTKGLSAKKIEESQKQFLTEKENALKAAQEQSTALREAREKDTARISHAIFLELINIEG
jgi:vacuolar-type H+-ATPase subunit H